MSEIAHTPTPWTHQGLDVKGRHRGNVFIIGENLGGLVGAALPWPTELDERNYARVLANADFIVTAVNAYDKQRALIEALTARLEASVTAIDDWLNIFAEVLCDPERVAEAKARTGEFGTLWYIATTQQANREALAAAKEQSA